jgi:hypothetical protein
MKRIRFVLYWMAAGAALTGAIITVAGLLFLVALSALGMPYDDQVVAFAQALYVLGVITLYVMFFVVLTSP